MKNKTLKESLPLVWANIKKLPWILGRHAFIVILFLTAIDIIFGASVFYKYIYLAERNQPQITKSPSAFNKNIYQEVLKNWQAREQELQSGKIPDTF